jgi:hypothetical protein
MFALAQALIAGVQTRIFWSFVIILPYAFMFCKGKGTL